MPYSGKILNRQVMNFNVNMGDTIVPRTNQQVGIGLRFVPDTVIVRQITYNIGIDQINNGSFQVYSDIALDQILCSFPNAPCSSTPNTEFIVKPNFQTGTMSLQIQTVPPSGTGTGLLYNPVNANFGLLSLILEFIRYEK